jgi:hypothetical protein
MIGSIFPTAVMAVKMSYNWWFLWGYTLYFYGVSTNITGITRAITVVHPFQNWIPKKSIMVPWNPWQSSDQPLLLKQHIAALRYCKQNHNSDASPRS